jgi:hypothetical protein
MIAIALAFLAASSTPRPVPLRESPPAPYLEVWQGREAIKPHVSKIKSCQLEHGEEVRCLVVRHGRHETGHAVRHRPEPTGSLKGIRVFFTPGWKLPKSRTA